MTLEILTPEHKIFDGSVKSVQMPGQNGLFQVLEGHAAMISRLAQGAVKIELSKSARGETWHSSLTTKKGEDNVLWLNIEGGVAEINGDKVILLAS